MKFYLTCFLFFFFISINSQYLLPIHSSECTIVSGFGEYRKTHYHFGWDFRTGNLKNKQIRSIANGYVSRIRCLSSSYGKVVEVKHSDGLTSLYAHLDKFTPLLDSVVRSYQYQKQQYDVIIDLDSGIYPVKKGQILGIAGNTGYSFGEHLHFELRDRNNILVHPSSLLRIKDEIPPVIKSINFYPMWKGLPIYPLRPISVSNTSNYAKISLPFGEYMIGLEAYDYQFYQGPTLPIYGWRVKINDTLYFQMEFNCLSIDEKNYVHVMYDPIAQITKRRINLAHPLLKEIKTPHVFMLERTLQLNPLSRFEISIETYDHNKNETSWKAIITASVDENLSSKNFISRKDEICFRSLNISFIIPSGALPGWVEKNQLWFKEINKKSCEVGFFYLPLLKPCTLIFFPINPNGKELLVITNEKNDTLDIIKPLIAKNDSLYFIIDKLGKYHLITDTIPPKLIKEPLFHHSEKTKARKICWIIKDVSKMISTYDIYVNDSWKLLEYDKKSDTFCLEMENWNLESKTLKIRVCDGVGNCFEKIYSF
ncbi:MAG: M23 family metallopeptidase [Bacteroidales bacterium]|nr:M23 family metallopeptidase [Bacteroidales bacterium]